MTNISDSVQEIIRRDKWDESYNRSENFIFYPKEDYIKFLNRFIRKKTDVSSFKDILQSEGKLKALDYGCGIGRLAILFEEFGVEAYGTDISEKAIQTAKNLSQTSGFDMNERFWVADGFSIPFPDNFFDFACCEAVLDSMPFSVAKACFAELARVTKSYIFFSVISGESHYKEYAGEDIVETLHENNTIQSYFNFEKIHQLCDVPNIEVKEVYLNTSEYCTQPRKDSRYFILAKKNS